MPGHVSREGRSVFCIHRQPHDALLPDVATRLLTVTLQAQDAQIYVLPLSERGAGRLWAVISD